MGPRDRRSMTPSDGSSALLEPETQGELFDADIEDYEPTPEDLEIVDAVFAAFARRDHVDWSHATELAPKTPSSSSS